MADYLPARTGASSSALDRRSTRAIEHTAAGASLEIARTRAVEAVACARVEALSAVTAAALVEVANLSAVEAAMFERAPHAAGRLRFVADSGASAIAAVVAATGRDLR